MNSTNDGIEFEHLVVRLEMTYMYQRTTCMSHAAVIDAIQYGIMRTNVQFQPIHNAFRP